MPTAATPIKYFLFLVPLAMGAGYYAGNQIAVEEVAMHKAEKLELNTAQGTLVKVLVDVPADAVIEASMVEPQKAFSNRIEADLVTSMEAVVGKKTRYGLNKGQMVAKDDLEEK